MDAAARIRAGYHMTGAARMGSSSRRGVTSSSTRAIILRKVLKPCLIATFIGVVGTGILVGGYIFNYFI
jgi:lambda repressor-like predicted transcriptional regulator